MSERYSRQELFREIGPAGQEKLHNSSVLILGCGALGCLHAEMLARAGVGQVRIVDRDFVEFTNLQRQTLFTEADAAERMPKAVAGAARLRNINSEIDLEPIVADVNSSNIEQLIARCNIVVDGTDNFQTRYLLNDACVKQNIPWVYGAAVSSYGATMTIRPGVTPCLRCIFPEMPEAASTPTCDTAGVIMPIIATVSAVQVTETLKLLIGDTESLHASLLQLDVWTNDRQRIRLDGPDPECKTCGYHEYEFLNGEQRAYSAVLCGRNAVQLAPERPVQIDLARFVENLSGLNVKQNEYLLRFASGEHEVTLFKDGRAIIKGTDDIAVARSLYARYIGI